jgi:hypothetical protein
MRNIIKKILMEGFEDAIAKKLELKKEKLINVLKKYPNEISLFRILSLDDEKKINLKEPGSHYSMDLQNLIKNYNFLKSKRYFLLTVMAPVELIDVDQTVENNLYYPNEKEITLKNKGFGSEVISVQELKF